MHKFAEEIAECLKAKVKAVGIDNIEGANLEEVKTWSEIVKNLVCYDKDFKIVEAMEKENDDEESMRMYRKYSEDDYPEKEQRYYNHYRYQNGRYAPKGSGTYRRNFEDDMEMNNRNYNDWSHMDDKERMRDIDRYYGDRMYYSGMMPMNPQYPRVYFEDRRDTNGSGGNHFTNPMVRDYREGRSGMSRRMYMESKESGDKNSKMQNLDKYLEELKTDMKEMVQNMTPEEKQMWQQRLTNMASTM